MAALKLAKESGARVTKTSIMLGCGEQPHEVLHAFQTLRDNGMSPMIIVCTLCRMSKQVAYDHFVCVIRADVIRGSCGCALPWLHRACTPVGILYLMHDCLVQALLFIGIVSAHAN